MYFEDIPHEYIKIPIKAVRVRQFGRFWLVEYRKRDSRFFWDRFWWYDESHHSCPIEAQVRANVLIANKYVAKFKRNISQVKIEPIDFEE